MNRRITIAAIATISLAGLTACNPIPHALNVATTGTPATPPTTVVVDQPQCHSLFRSFDEATQMCLLYVPLPQCAEDRVINESTYMCDSIEQGDDSND